MKSPSPFVSVIVPVKNGGGTFRLLLESLGKQTYPADCYEVIVADNGSTDGTFAWAEEQKKTFPVSLSVLKADGKPGSYASRNAGIAVARGDLFAFTDADCLPVPGWLEAGVKALLDTPADLAGGQVTFVFAGARPNGAEAVDATTNMQMERDILRRAVTKTANLFAKKEVFDRVGLFPGDLQSGGDVQWSRAATSAGFRLIFSPEAEIYHPARGWSELLRKQLRVGYGQIPVMRAAGMSWPGIFLDVFGIREKKAPPLKKIRVPRRQQFPVPWSYLPAKVAGRLGTLAGRVLWVLDQCAGSRKIRTDR